MDFMVSCRVRCQMCGEDLKAAAYEEREGMLVEVSPCETCMKLSNEEGYTRRDGEEGSE